MQTQIGKDIATAKELLEKGEVVAIPTETVYGLAGNALNEEAVVKIYAAKNRPHFNPLIIHVPAIEQLEKYVTHVPEKAKQLAATFCPGPLTFLLPKKPVVPDIVTAGSDYVAIRIPAHPLTLELLRQIDFPLAAPSANPFGYVSPTTAQHVMEHLQGKIPYILDGGECSIGVESTIIQFNEQDQIIVNRVGGVAVEGIEKITGEKVILHTTTENQPAAPGQLKSHYATHTPLVVGSIDLLLDLYKDKKVIIISFTRSYTHPALQKQYVLSPAGHMEEAAQKLFKTLRAADTLEADVILAEHFPDEGLGRAINDRLHRAQHIYK